MTGDAMTGTVWSAWLAGALIAGPSAAAGAAGAQTAAPSVVSAPAAPSPVAPPPVAPPFDSLPPPAVPDYAQPSAWAARPGAEGPAALVPPGATPAATHAGVDVFYIHPTTYRSRTTWNADVADAETNHWTDISVIARQASVFNGCCRVFAPRYRQASLAAFSSPQNGGKAYALAYVDVLSAFDHYMAHDNHGRSFILAGHSQGALMAKRLLAERIRGTAAAKRMVAAYVLGIGIARGDFGYALAGLKPCTGAGDTGCVLSWNSWLEGSDTRAYRTRAVAEFTAAHPGADGVMLCRNPLNLAGGDPVPSRGTLPGAARDSGLQALVPGTVEARCDAGVVLVRVDPALGLGPLPGGNMHYHDVSLYYGEIRADAVRRARAFMTKGKTQ